MKMPFEFLNLNGLTDPDEIFKYGEQVFSRRYLNQSKSRGQMKAHDGEDVTFYLDRYDHAFRTSVDRARYAHNKGKVAIERIERVLWIADMISKVHPNITCKEQTPPPRWKRVYYCYDNNYVVWLEPLRVVNGRPVGWKFSSAYPQPVTDFKRTAHGFKTMK